MSMTERPSVLRFHHPLPYGAIVHDGGVQFVVFSRSGTAMRVLLYDEVDQPDPTDIIDFDPELNRWGDIWSIFVPGLGAGQLYHFQADGPHEPHRGHRFDPQSRLIDPYAKALAGTFLPADGGIIRPPKCVVMDDEFNWEGDRHLRRELSETVIYEMHVRGFTKSRSSGVDRPGTYLGVIDKIPYLKSLGVTAVELMPVAEFPICDCLGQRLAQTNYWGYDPLVFFSPHRGYANSNERGAQVREFKEMVLALHQAGIEVILDVVFNHTAEGNHEGPVLNFKGLENRVYYMLENGGQYYRNYSGCGNTLNGNHPVVREMIFHCLRYWVHHYHIDGFRFDLASILSRDRDGNIIPNPPVVESTAEDPLLADTKIIAEAWDAAGAYQVGSFAKLRWAEWNGRYRDDVRRYWRGDPHMVPPLATRLAGSSDLYEPSGREPYHSINFITSHDGFPLSDLVTYNHKHNEANGEDNRDGDNNNLSYNYGVEGPTRRRAIEDIRLRQIKNMLTTLMLSQGVPMLLMGDECRRTQRGNNNAYCQDNAISWFDWRHAHKHRDLFRFVRSLIQFRRREPAVRQTDFLRGQPRRPGGLPDVSWYGADGRPVNWQHDERGLQCLLAAVTQRDPTAAPNHHVLMMFHAGAEPRRFFLPEIARGLAWWQFVNTGEESPRDIHPELDGPAAPASGWIELVGRSTVVYVARDEV
ncbi:MAG: glycogen debranching protein GlgX [Patescibacteria group bacterium]|nr:glycogen debranching protein GlgX [Patescibacteria group bacterium]